MYNRYCLLGSLIAIPALHCHVDLDENVIAAFGADPIILKALSSEGFIAEEGDDAQLRLRYENTQAAFEQFLVRGLALGSIKHVIAVIHTPLPATPVCIMDSVDQPRIETDSSGCVDLYSCQSSMIRALLQRGGGVVVAYPAVNRAQRSKEQIALFDSLLAQYEGNLFDVPMGCLEVATEMVGATYLFKTPEGSWNTFSIRSTQAIAPATSCRVAMWLGDAEKGPAAERLAQVSAYLQACQGPNLLAYIHK